MSASALVIPEVLPDGLGMPYLRQGYQALDRLAAAEFRRLVAAGRWQWAVTLAVQLGVSGADIARMSGTSRSTVSRWMIKGAKPMDAAIPDIASAIEWLILNRHACERGSVLLARRVTNSPNQD